MKEKSIAEVNSPEQLANYLRMYADLLDRGAEFLSGGLIITNPEPGIVLLQADLLVEFFDKNEIEKKLH